MSCRARQRKSNDSKHDKVSAASEIRQFVKMQRPCDGEEEELIGDGDEEGDGEVVLVEYVMWHCERCEGGMW